MSDDDLLARIAGGDRQSFAVLVRRHLPRALALARRILGGGPEAEEVVQEAWLRVWSAAGRWDPEGEARFTTWLHRVVVNLCLNRRRRAPSEPIDEADGVVDPAPGALSGVIRAQLAGRVSEALAGLPDRQRAAIALCYYDELTAAEAGFVLDLSVSAVESLLARARRALRERLAALGITSAEE